MKNLNQLFKIPVLDYKIENKENFENQQLDKFYEEIIEVSREKDDIKKCCECFDIIQLC